MICQRKRVYNSIRCDCSMSVQDVIVRSYMCDPKDGEGRSVPSRYEY